MSSEINQSIVLGQRTDLFDARVGLNRGASIAKEILWNVVKSCIFMSSIPWPSGFKRFLLILFGANIGCGFYIRPRVNIHFPWKLTVGKHCWIGEDTGILNLESVTIGDYVAIAHRVYIATGNHDYTDSKMTFRNSSIAIKSGVWIASCVFVGPGVTVGDQAVLAAGSIVTRNVDAYNIVRGNPATVISKRVFRK